MSKITILVPKGFGKTMRNLKDLSIEELDRLTSRTKGPEENLKIEFEIEKNILALAEKFGIQIKEERDGDEDHVFAFIEKGLAYTDEKKAIKELDLPIPETKKFSELENVPAFPFVIKNPESRRGRDVFLISNEEAFGRLRKFLASSSVFIKSLNKEITYDASVEREKLLCQQYIETPSERFTSYRVVVSCVGTILCSSMIYSGHTKSSAEKISFKQTGEIKNRDLFIIEDSPFCIHSPKITSNIHKGGDEIILERNPNSKPIKEYERDVLRAHGLDLEDPKLPEFIKTTSAEIGKYYGRQGKGLIFGIDWTQSNKGDYFYMETNLIPSGITFIDAYMNGRGAHAEAYGHMMEKIFKEISKL